MGNFIKFIKEAVTFTLHQDSDGDHYAKVYHNGVQIHRTMSNRSQTTAKQYGDQAIAYFNSEEGKKHLKESVENHAFLQQSLADKDINSKIENGKVVVHKDNVAKAKAHVKKLGHTVSVVSGLNEESVEINEDDTISHVLNLKGHMQDAKESNNPKLVVHYLEKLRKLHGTEYSTNVYKRAQTMMEETEELDEGNMAAGWSPREMKKHLLKHGFEFKKNGGSHDIYFHPKTKEDAALPRHNQDLATGTAKQLLDKVKRAQQVNEDIHSSADYKIGKDGRKHPASRITFKEYSDKESPESEELRTKILRAKNGQRAAKALGEERLDEIRKFKTAEEREQHIKNRAQYHADWHDYHKNAEDTLDKAAVEYKNSGDDKRYHVASGMSSAHFHAAEHHKAARDDHIKHLKSEPELETSASKAKKSSYHIAKANKVGPTNSELHNKHIKSSTPAAGSGKLPETEKKPESRSNEYNDGKLKIKDGEIHHDGKKVGTVNHHLKNGYHPVVRVTTGEHTHDFELDHKDLHKSISNHVKGHLGLKESMDLDEVVSVKYEMNDDGMHVAHVSTRDKHGNTENHSYTSKEKSKLGAHIKKTHGHLMKDSKDGDMGGLKQKSKYEYVEDNSSKAAKGTKV